MHILHVIDSLSIGGAERMLVDLANATVEDGHRVSVCVTRLRTDLANELHPNISLLVLGRKKRFELSAMRAFAQFVNKQGVQILHVHGRSSFSFVMVLETLRLLNTPIILHDHFGSIEINSSIPLWFRFWGSHLVTQYVGVYEKLAQWALASGMPGNKVQTIGNALNLKRITTDHCTTLRQEFHIPDSIKIGIVICGIRPEKGIDLLIDSLKQVNMSHPFQIFIIGKEHDAEYTRNCRDKLTAFGLEDRVIFIGERLNAALLAHEADFGLMPSRSESGPLVLIEFMASGLPFAAFNVGDISQKASALNVPGFVEPQNTIALAREIEALLQMSASELSVRGIAGQQIAHENFSIQSKLPEWYRVYNKALKQEIR